MNRLTIYGRLGKDKTIKELKGKRCLELSIAEGQKEKDQEVTLWYKVLFWHDIFRNIEEYLKKGTAVIVEGMQKRPRIYHNKEGIPQVSLEIIGISINFSPFGKTGKSEEEAKSQTNQHNSDEDTNFYC